MPESMHKRRFRFSLRKLLLWTTIWAAYLAVVRMRGIELVPAFILTGWLAVILIARLRWGLAGRMSAVLATGIVVGCLASVPIIGYESFLLNLIQAVMCGLIGLVIVSGMVRLVDWIDAFGRKAETPCSSSESAKATVPLTTQRPTLTNPKSTAKWRRLRFGLWTLLVVLLSLPLGWFVLKMRDAERQGKAVEAIEKAGGTVGYDQVGQFANVTSVWLGGSGIGDEGLEHVEGLLQLDYLDLSDTQTTDAGLEHLKGLTRLKAVKLNRTHVTFQGIKELRKALPECEIDWYPPPTPETNLDQP